MRPGSEDGLICQITSALLVHLVLVVKAEVFNLLQTNRAKCLVALLGIFESRIWRRPNWWMRLIQFLGSLMWVLCDRDYWLSFDEMCRIHQCKVFDQALLVPKKYSIRKLRMIRSYSIYQGDFLQFSYKLFA